MIGGAALLQSVAGGGYSLVVPGAPEVPLTRGDVVRLQRAAAMMLGLEAGRCRQCRGTQRVVRAAVSSDGLQALIARLCEDCRRRRYHWTCELDGPPAPGEPWCVPCARCDGDTLIPDAHPLPPPLPAWLCSRCHDDELDCLEVQP